MIAIHQKIHIADEAATITTGLSQGSKMTMMRLQQLDVISRADAERQSETSGATMVRGTIKVET